MQFLDGIVLKSAELLDVCVNTEKAATLDNPGALLSFFFTLMQFGFVSSIL